jgi:hypothetical protein
MISGARRSGSPRRTAPRLTGSAVNSRTVLRAEGMTIAVVVFLPFVLAHQAWTYYVFRRRISAAEFHPGTGPTGNSGRMDAGHAGVTASWAREQE